MRPNLARRFRHRLRGLHYRSAKSGRATGRLARPRPTFFFRLIRDDMNAGDHPSEDEPDLAAPSSSANQPEAKPADSAAKTSSSKILIVDDDFEIIESVRYALEGAGYEVVIARDGNQGLALAERENPDLMILDMMMPKRSGFLVLEKLRRLRDEPLPVIMITGNEGSRHKAYAELLGVNDYIRKPFAMDRLLAAVEKLLTSQAG